MSEFIPATETSDKIEISHSKFIATAAPAMSVEEARKFIEKIKLQYSDATHNVPAFKVGTKNVYTSHSSDDGEPAGSAGKPILTVLENSEFSNIVVVVTRYFGGIKLGVGGLVRAYSGIVKQLLEKIPKAVVTVVSRYSIQIGYSQYEPFLKMSKMFPLQIENTEFTDSIKIALTIKNEDSKRFLHETTELCLGRLKIEKLDSDLVQIHPV